MSNTQHTPGPWAFLNDALCQAHGNYLHLGKWTESPGLGKAAEANKRLIAAAPAMLEALQWVTRCLERPGPHMDPQAAIERARAAIRKATEGTPAIEQGFPGRAEALAALSQREDEGRY